MSENPHIYPFQRPKDDSGQNKKTTNTAKNTKIHKTSADTVKPSLQMIKKLMTADSKKLFGKLKVLDIVLIIAAFMLGRSEILGDIYPFAPAFVAVSALCHPKNAVYFLVASAAGTISVLGIGSIPYIIAYITLFILFSFYRVDERKKWLVVPACTFGTVAVLRTLIGLFRGISSFDMMVVFFEAAFAAGFAAIMIVMFVSLAALKKHERLSTDELICCFVVLLGCINGVNGIEIMNVAISDVASRLLVMLVAFCGGAGAAAGVGAMMGVIPSLSAVVSPSVIGVYAFSGLLAGAFNAFGRVGVSIGFCLGNVILSLYLLESSQITAQLITTLTAVAIFFCIPGSFINRCRDLFGQVSLKSAAEERNDRLLQLSAARLRSTAWIFRELSQSCHSLSSQHLPDNSENIQMVFNHLSQKICKNCSVNNLCWKIDIEETYAGVMALFRKASENGYVNIRDTPENFQRRCPHLKELIATVNCLYELYCRSNYWQQQKAGSREFIAGQLEGTAQVLENLSKEIGRQNKDREVLEREIASSLTRQGNTVDSAGLMAKGDKMLDLFVNFAICPGEEHCRSVIAETVSEATGKNYIVYDVNCAGRCGEKCRFNLLEAGAKTVKIGRAQLAKAGGICGDSDGSVMLGDGKQLIMLSDGMGVGAKAAIQSGAAINILSRLLEVGFDKETAIDTVNTILMLQGQEESFVTLDMCIIDLYRSSAEFIKTGGAPSFIKRGSQIDVVEAASLPVGMLQSIDKVCVSETLASGDMVILASDGLLDAAGKSDTKWLQNIMSKSEITDPQKMAEYLLTKAISVSGGRLRDDITVIVAQMQAS